MSTQKQTSYIIYAFKSNLWQFEEELNNLFPSMVENGIETRYSKMEVEISKLDFAQVSDIISMLKDDLILEGFNQLHYLISN